jgi:hypothetical protein
MKSNVNAHGLGYSSSIMPLFKTKYWLAAEIGGKFLLAKPQTESPEKGDLY